MEEGWNDIGENTHRLFMDGKVVAIVYPALGPGWRVKVRHNQAEREMKRMNLEVAKQSAQDTYESLRNEQKLLEQK